MEEQTEEREQLRIPSIVLPKDVVLLPMEEAKFKLVFERQR